MDSIMYEKDLIEPLFSGSEATHSSVEQLEGGESEPNQEQQVKGKAAARGDEIGEASVSQMAKTLQGQTTHGPSDLNDESRKATPMANQPNPEILRLIQQYLRENGMQKIAQDIEVQTGVDMEHNSVIRFRQCILNGNYKELFSKEIVSHSSLKTGGKCISIFDQVSAQLIPQKRQLLMYFIYEQQYIELMEQGKNIEAITLLQKQLVPHSPFGRDKSNLFKLASMIMKKPLQDCSRAGPNCAGGANGQERQDIIEKRENNKVVMEFEQNAAEKTEGDALLEDNQIRDRQVKEESMAGGEAAAQSRQRADKVVADTQMNDEAQERIMRRTPLDIKIQKMRENLLQKLHEYLPKNSMLLPNRLEKLLGQSIQWQISQCQYHNVDETRFSLLVDHTCPPSLIPTTCMATLRRHKEQVWFCKFNNQGDKIATVCKEGQILIWSILKVDNKLLPSQMVNQAQNSTSQYRLQLTYEIKEHPKHVSCVAWAPNGHWIVSGSNKDYVGRIWDVSFPHKSRKGARQAGVEGQPDVALQNQMVCTLKKHKFQLIKILFHTSTQLISCSHDKTIILWEVLTLKNGKGQIYYKARDFRMIRSTKHYLDIAITQNRLICRRGNPDGNIKIIKFKNLKTDVKPEMFTDEYYKKVKDEFAKNSKESNSVQPVVDHIDKADETIMEMMTSACGRFLLLNIRKPWLELWDLTKVPHPKCVQRFYGYQQDSYILNPSFAGINQSFVMIGSEATGEEAAIFIWKRDTGEQLCRIAGSGLFGHTNIIGQVDGNQAEPYMFVSCSDDETVKIWGVKDKIKLEIAQQSLTGGSRDGVIKVDVKAEEQSHNRDSQGNDGEVDESDGNGSRRYSSIDEQSDGELLSSSDDDTSPDEGDNEEEDEEDDNDEEDSSPRDTSESEDEDSRMSSGWRAYSQGSLDSQDEEGTGRRQRPGPAGRQRHGNEEEQQDSDEQTSNQSEGGEREQSRRGRRRPRPEEQKRSEQQEGDAGDEAGAANPRQRAITQHEGGSMQTNPSGRAQRVIGAPMQGTSLALGGNDPADPINDTEMTEEVPESGGDPAAHQIGQNQLPQDLEDNSQNPAGADYSETNSYMNDQDLQNEWQNQWNQQVQQQQRDILGQGDWLSGYDPNQEESQRYW